MFVVYYVYSLSHMSYSILLEENSMSMKACEGKALCNDC